MTWQWTICWSYNVVCMSYRNVYENLPTTMAKHLKTWVPHTAALKLYKILIGFWLSCFIYECVISSWAIIWAAELSHSTKFSVQPLSYISLRSSKDSCWTSKWHKILFFIDLVVRTCRWSFFNLTSARFLLPLRVQLSLYVSFLPYFYNFISPILVHLPAVIEHLALHNRKPR